MKTTGSVAASSNDRSVGDGAHVAGPRDRLRGKAEDGEAEHAVSRRDVRDARADGLDDAADFVAEDARVRRLRRDKARAP